MPVTETNDLWQTLEEDIRNSSLSEDQKKRMFQNLLNLKHKKLSILITGATGSGKSSTINSIFNMEVAKVGYGVDPETMDIQKFELGNLTLWDSPGLGDGRENDVRHSKNIIRKLTERDQHGDALIDVVLVIVDGSSRDLGTSYALINEVIIPNMPDQNHRILVAINQCDVAMKGEYWDNNTRKPEPELEAFLADKAKSVQRRIFEGTGVNIEPVYYSAAKYYNISKLLYVIIQSTPKDKRTVFLGNINENTDPWKSNDSLKRYNEEIKQSLWESVKDGASTGADIGGEIGSVFGRAGEAVGRVIGGVVGGVVGFFKGWFS